MEIWISNTIEKPNAGLSWNSKVFLSANIKQLIHPHYNFLRKSACFFIDQEKKVAVVFDKNARMGAATRDMAYIFVGGGVDDDGSSSFKQQVVKESAYPFYVIRDLKRDLERTRGNLIVSTLTSTLETFATTVSPMIFNPRENSYLYYIRPSIIGDDFFADGCWEK
ncbi:hypothetical protein YC2023_026872 [Brassica napus]